MMMLLIAALVNVVLLAAPAPAPLRPFFAARDGVVALRLAAALRPVPDTAATAVARAYSLPITAAAVCAPAASIRGSMITIGSISFTRLVCYCCVSQLVLLVRNSSHTCITSISITTVINVDTANQR